MTRTVPAGLRWFASAVAIAVAMGATWIGGSLGFSFLYWEVPSLLLVGAILSGQHSLAGRFFLRLGAVILTVLFLPMGVEELFLLHHYGSVYGHRYYSPYQLQQIVAAKALVLSVIAIDIALLLDFIRSGKAAA